MDSEKLLQKTAEFLALSQQTSSQPGDIHKAIYDAKILGLKSATGDPKDAEFDVNSPAADQIFGLFDKFGFKGKAVISVAVDPHQNATVRVLSQPTNPKLNAAISQVFQGPVGMAVKRVAPPAGVVQLENLVTAQNA